jgi:aldehyde dehydrogenase (NAD+)
MEMLVERTKRLKLGDGLLPTIDVGPCINEAQRRIVQSYVEIGKDEGAQLVCGGTIAHQGDLAKGWFYEPTIFGNVKPTMRIAQEEIFGPVLSVIRTTSFEEAIGILNGTI